jgi:uncharacterized protein
MGNKRDSGLIKLRGILADMKNVVVAFSGGTDSAFLLKMVMQTLGARKAFAVTGKSPIHPVWELEESRALTRLLGARHVVVNTCELDNVDFIANSPERCYFCKRELLTCLLKIAEEGEGGCIIDGTNLDDLGDFRPGRKAAKELGVRSPLLEAGLTKADIRFFSRKMGIPTWNKQAFSCLVSRFPYGTRITREKLAVVERCEDFLRSLGFKRYRLRHHGRIARIEIDREQFALMAEKAQEVVGKLKSAGFAYVALDLEGYRTGSMNEGLLLEGHAS